MLVASSLFCARIGGSCEVSTQGIDTESGLVQWFAAFPVSYHFSVSPVISDDGIVFLTASSVFALNVTTGDSLWESNIDGSSFSALSDKNLFTHSFYRGDLSALNFDGRIERNLTLDKIHIVNAVVSTGSSVLFVVGRSGNNTVVTSVEMTTFEISWLYTVPDFVGGNILVGADYSLTLIGTELIKLVGPG